MADTLGPNFSTVVGLGHEIQESVPHWNEREQAIVRQPLSEASMDLFNNAEGVRASRAGRQIDPHRLRMRPDLGGIGASRIYEGNR